MNKPFIEFQHITRVYGNGDAMVTAADNVSFTINEGEFVVILGQSGAGKSTILNILGGMDSPTSGKAIVDGRDIAGFSRKQLSGYRAKTIGFIFQFYNLIPSLTAKENVALTKNIVKDAANSMEVLKQVGLENRADKFPSQLSGGEQQRVSIARALAKNPKIILGDEPTGALDSETGIGVLELIQKMSTEHHTTVVLVTHNADIARCADRVIRMKNGKIRSIEINEHPVSAKEVNW